MARRKQQVLTLTEELVQASACWIDILNHSLVSHPLVAKEQKQVDTQYLLDKTLVETRKASQTSMCAGPSVL